MDITVKEILDTTGLSCPLPLLKAKQALAGLAVGEVLQVITTDAGSQRDFRSFTKLSGHELLQEEIKDGIYNYWLKKSQ